MQCNTIVTPASQREEQLQLKKGQGGRKGDSKDVSTMRVVCWLPKNLHACLYEGGESRCHLLASPPPPAPLDLDKDCALLQENRIFNALCKTSQSEEKNAKKS